MPESLRDDSGERTREPTSLRLREARQRGQVPRSADLTSAAVAAGVVIVLGLVVPGLLNAMTEMTATFLDGREAAIDARRDALGALTLRGARAPVAMVGAVLAASAALAALVGLTQVGPIVAPDRIRPEWERLSLGRGLARLFSARTAARAGMTLAKLAAVAGAGYWMLRPLLSRLAAAGGLDAAQLLAQAGSLAASLAVRIVLCLLLLALGDYLYQRWQHRRDLRMTHRQWREDMKRIDGDWRLRQRRKEMARGLGDWQAARAVPSAALVLYDPRGRAVALRYGAADEAPRVVAKGTGWSAVRIRRVAATAGVPAAADAAAAREICQHCRTGEEIPRRLYECVARALAGATERPAEQQAAAAPQESSRRLGQRGEADRASLGLELGTSG